MRLGVRLLALVLMGLTAHFTYAACPPKVKFLANEALYLPVLDREVREYWKGEPLKSVFAAQVQQESCITLKHPKCWSPMAELKTSREYGFGLGQITITSRFDNFKEAKKLDTSLKDWAWENRYNAEFQLRTLVLMDFSNYSKFGWAENDLDRMGFALAGYNGGVGGVLSDRAVCKTVPGCNPNLWFGNVENTSKKAKLPVSGYGQSFFQINRSYVSNGLGFRRTRYLEYFGECSND